MTIRIVTDSTCDLPPEIIQELDIRVIPLYINIGEDGYLDGVDITRQEFYSNLGEYSTHPTTGTPGIDTFLNVYQELADHGATEIISIHISESLSATIDVARTAADQFETIPVIVVDSQQLSLGTGFQVETAARMAKEGRNSDDILVTIEDLASRTFVAAALDTLEFLRRSGRMNAIITGLGSLLQLKPILTMYKGKPGSERVRTASKALQRVVAMLVERTPIERFALLHTNAAKAAKEIETYVRKVLPENDVYSVDITPVIGAHIGPGAIGYAIVSQR